MKTIITVLLLAAAFSFAQNKTDDEIQNHCGTYQIIKQRIEQQKGTQHNPLASTYAYNCTASDYYDSVYTKKTDHFQIFYTLDGPHATTQEFIDSVAYDVELAYKFHTKTMGMLPPLGESTTWHYQQKVEEGLYPVEILDIDLVRSGISCSECFGLTNPNETNPEISELMIDNDFRYSLSGAEMASYTKNGKSCSYRVATEELFNNTYDYSYAEHWGKGIRVTAFHELYHAVQVRYLNLYANPTFWFEASASGIEEIAAPDIDDYVRYLSYITSIKNLPLGNWNQPYAAGILLIYLHNFVDAKTDRYIWENFKKDSDGTFQDQFQKFTEKKQLSADSLFQDFATRLSFAGKRSQFIDSTELICADEATWPSISYENSASHNSEVSFTPNINNLAYMFYSGGKPLLVDYTGKSSAILYKGKEAEIVNLTSSNDAEMIFEKSSSNPDIDSIAWVFSNFNSTEILPTILSDSTLRAYPVPWREGALCFTPLPHDKNYIEIRNRRGNLVTRENYEGSSHCIGEDRVKELMVPGVYRFRVGNHGKTSNFIIIY